MVVQLWVEYIKGPHSILAFPLVMRVKSPMFCAFVLSAEMSVLGLFRTDASVFSRLPSNVYYFCHFHCADFTYSIDFFVWQMATRVIHLAISSHMSWPIMPLFCKT